MKIKPNVQTISAKSLAVALVCFCTPIASANAELNLTFGTYAADKPTETVRKFKPLLRSLEQALKTELGETVKISIRICSDSHLSHKTSTPLSRSSTNPRARTARIEITLTH